MVIIALLYAESKRMYYIWDEILNLERIKTDSRYIDKRYRKIERVKIVVFKFMFRYSID